jgi:hypothetical protein
MAQAAGLIIVFALIAAFICGKSGSGFGALLFLSIALVVFINTPAGAGLPGGLAQFFTTINNATSPVLNGGSPGPRG